MSWDLVIWYVCLYTGLTTQQDSLKCPEYRNQDSNWIELANKDILNVLELYTRTSVWICPEYKDGSYHTNINLA